MAGRLEGKVAIVTGGNSGIGEATVYRFAAEGARVGILARREEEGLAVQETVRQQGNDALFVPCDVADDTAVEAAIAKVVETYGALHVLFNNAGGGAREMFPNESNETWDNVLRVNLSGTFYVTRAAWPHFITAGSGSVINMSSYAAVSAASPTHMELLKFLPSASYAASKAGIEALTRYMAGQGGPKNIRVNCVRPGRVQTTRLTTPEGTFVWEDYFNSIQLLEGSGRPEDIANTVLFLASDEARFITAGIIDIDGGAAGKV